MQKARDIVKQVLKELKGDCFDYEENLITDGLISSFDLLFMVQKLETYLVIHIPLEKIEPEQFNSIDDILDLIKQCE